MDPGDRTISLELTPIQYESLKKLSSKDNCDVSCMVSRILDAAILTNSSHLQAPFPTQKMEDMHKQTVQLLVCVMKLLGQILYFVSLPLTFGPVKSKLTNEGVAVHWRQSERFAGELLTPPKHKTSTILKD